MPSRFSKNIFILCIFINLLVISLILLFQKNLPPIVPLLYGLPVSKSQLVPTVALSLPSIIAILVSLINFNIIKFTKDTFLEKIFLGITISATALAIITIINVASLIGKI